MQSCECCEIFKSTFFDRTPLVAGSGVIIMEEERILTSSPSGAGVEVT